MVKALKRLPWSAEEDATLNNSHQTYGISKGSSTPQIICRQWIFCSLLVLAGLIHLCHGDIGAAGQYKAPYLPTACSNDSDDGQLPPSELFGSAGEGIWDNGEACGRLYKVECISGPEPTTCVPGLIIQIKIVDRANTSVSRPSKADADIVLSTTAFGAIANASAATFINIQFIQA